MKVHKKKKIVLSHSLKCLIAIMAILAVSAVVLACLFINRQGRVVDKMKNEIDNLRARTVATEQSKADLEKEISEKDKVLSAAKTNIYTIQDKTFSFVGSLDKINPVDGAFYGARDLWAFYYGDDFEVTNQLNGPYAVYTNDVKASTMNFKCDGPSVNYTNGKDPFDLNRVEVPWFYCETNGEDWLTQYEFSGAEGLVIMTGGGYGERWYKLYLKKVKGENLIFIGTLSGDDIDTEDSYEGGAEALKKMRAVSSKAYLDELLKKEDNIKKIAEWDAFVKSFDIVQ